MYSNYYFAAPKVCRTNSKSAGTPVQKSYRPKMNVLHKEDQIILEFSIPGVMKEDVKMSFSEQILTLEAIRKVSQDEKNYKYREFGPVDFKTNVRFADDIDEDKVEAEFQNGILKVVLNKIKKQNIQVEIK